MRDDNKDDAHNLHRRIMLALGTGDSRLFRNNTGMGWQGTSIWQQDRTLVLVNPRPLHAGLFVGSGDLIGWRSIEVLPEHVGRRFAMFLSIEAKTGRGRMTEAQRTWAEAVRRAGGIAGEARTVEEAIALVRG